MFTENQKLILKNALSIYQNRTADKYENTSDKQEKENYTTILNEIDNIKEILNI